MTCAHWPSIEAGRCKALAVWRLYAPDGEPNPGGWYCHDHARAIVDEYSAKLGERWTLWPVDEWGQPVRTPIDTPPMTANLELFTDGAA